MTRSNYGNGPTRIILSPNGATIFLGILTATFLEGIRSDEDLETLLESLTTYWSIARERLPGQVELSAASDERSLRVLLDALIGYLRASHQL